MPNPTYKEHIAFCKKHIHLEEKLLSSLNEIIDKMYVAKIFNKCKETGATLTLTNTDGTSWSKDSMDFVNSFSELTEEELREKISSCERDKKLSIYKQKFWRYAHNLNKEQAKKYAEKSQKLQSEILDELMFEGDDDQELCVLLREEDNSRTFVENEHAVVKLGNEFKKWKELTDSFIKNFHRIPRK